MYNRYIPQDAGRYERVPEEPSGGPPPDGGRRGFLSGILERLNLKNLDTGDLILLLLIFLLYKDGADEELLIALGLLLIL